MEGVINITEELEKLEKLKALEKSREVHDAISVGEIIETTGQREAYEQEVLEAFRRRRIINYDMMRGRR